VKARESDAVFSKILTDRLISTRFQSIVELESGTVVAYEALSRGPVDTEFHYPAALFDRAHTLGLVTDLDLACWLLAVCCRLSSVRTATEQGFTTAHTLFVNVEPGSLRRSGLARPTAPAGTRPDKTRHGAHPRASRPARCPGDERRRRAR
jgi:EAL domain-containing protein (putative c-di-GMP-specific phosphodiesterase class I)